MPSGVTGRAPVCWVSRVSSGAETRAQIAHARRRPAQMFAFNRKLPLNSRDLREIAGREMSKCISGPPDSECACVFQSEKSRERALAMVADSIGETFRIDYSSNEQTAGEAGGRAGAFLPVALACEIWPSGAASVCVCDRASVSESRADDGHRTRRRGRRPCQVMRRIRIDVQPRRFASFVCSFRGGLPPPLRVGRALAQRAHL